MVSLSEPTLIVTIAPTRKKNSVCVSLCGYLSFTCVCPTHVPKNHIHSEMLGILMWFMHVIVKTQGPELLVVIDSQPRQVYVNAQTHGTNRITVVAWQLATVSV